MKSGLVMSLAMVVTASVLVLATMTRTSAEELAEVGYSRVEEAAEMSVEIENRCGFDVWPGVYPVPPLFLDKAVVLRTNSSVSIKIRAWDDTYIWARTGCVTGEQFSQQMVVEEVKDNKMFQSCDSGFCGGAGYAFRCFFGMPNGPPISSVFFRNMRYTVDLSSGFNVPVTVRSNSASFNSGNTKCPGNTMGCKANLLEWCPPQMRVLDSSKTKVVACSPCNRDILDINSNSEELSNYYQHLQSSCPCTHPISTPVFPSLDQALQGYTITFCPA